MAKSENNKRAKVQAYVEGYSCYVLDKLIEIKGKSRSDVASFVIKDWIGDHKDELVEYGITVGKWKKEIQSNKNSISGKYNSKK